MNMKTLRPSSRRRSGWLSDSSGTAAVEFSLLLPIFGALLVGVIDFGGIIIAKSRLNSAVSAASNYTIVSASNVTAAGGGGLADSLAAIINAAGRSGSVVVNAGPTRTITAGQSSSSGIAQNAASCYCPTVANHAVTWGSATTCGAACAGGSTAGKFVWIRIASNYTPAFSNYGLVVNGVIDSQAMVRIQ